MKFLALLALPLAMAAVAKPASKSSSSSTSKTSSSSSSKTSSSAAATITSKTFTDTFDNHAVAAGLDQANLVDNTAGGAINYNGFVYSAPDQLTEKVPSSPNVILTAALAGQDIEGQPAFYVNSSYKCFTPKSIYYAITVNSEQSAANVAETGTIQASGVEYGTGLTVVQELIYNPTPLQVPFQFGFANFAPSFACVTTLNLELIQSTGGSSSATNTLMFDNVTYTAYSN